MELILLTDELYHLVKVTKEMTEGIELLSKTDCFDLCDILRLHLTTYYEHPVNAHVMNNGSGDLYGCICNE
jgi:hypothetical protein